MFVIPKGYRISLDKVFVPVAVRLHGGAFGGVFSSRPSLMLKDTFDKRGKEYMFNPRIGVMEFDWDSQTNIID